jgi:hypothetical protein
MFSGVQGSVVNTPVLTGAKSYSLVSGEGGLYQDVSGLTPGQVYTIEGWARASSASTADLFVHDTTGAGSVTTGNVSLDTNWKRFAVSFTATATGAMRVHLHRGTSGSTVYWDDIVIRNGPWF